MPENKERHHNESREFDLSVKNMRAQPAELFLVKKNDFITKKVRKGISCSVQTFKCFPNAHAAIVKNPGTISTITGRKENIIKLVNFV